MKKLLVLSLLLGLILSPCFGVVYREYEGTLAYPTNEVIATAESTIGNTYGKGGFICNDSSTTDAWVYFNCQGAVWGDKITVKAGEYLNFDVFPQYKSVKVDTPSTPESVTYRMNIGINKIAIESM